MDTITATEVQYVRCIKPNANKSSKEYNRALVVEQLRSAGMIEVANADHCDIELPKAFVFQAVRISRAAFPNRLTYIDFMGRYRCLRKESWYESKRQQSHSAGNLAGLQRRTDISDYF
jgi:myosin-5